MDAGRDVYPYSSLKVKRSATGESLAKDIQQCEDAAKSAAEKEACEYILALPDMQVFPCSAHTGHPGLWLTWDGPGAARRLAQDDLL